MTASTHAPLSPLALSSAHDDIRRARDLTAQAKSLRDQAFRTLGYPRGFHLGWDSNDRDIRGKTTLATDGFTADIILRGRTTFGRDEESAIAAEYLSVTVMITDSLAQAYVIRLPTADTLGIDGVTQLEALAVRAPAYSVPAENGPAFAKALEEALCRTEITI